MRKLLLVFVTLVVVVGAALPGDAATAAAASGSAASRSLGDSFVSRLVEEGSCTDVARHGLFGNGASYLASCTGGDGTFRFLVVVPVKRGGLDVDTKYIRDRIDDVCHGAGGAVFSAGVKDRFAAMYLGRGDDTEDGSGAYRAATLFNGLTEQLVEEPGAFHSGHTCAQGRVVQKVS